MTFQELDEQCGGVFSAVCSDARIRHLSSDAAEHYGSQLCRCRCAKLEPHTSTVTLDSSRNVQTLFKVAFQREVDERTPQRRQLEGRGTSTLHDRQIAGGQVFVQSVHITFSLNPLGQAKGVDGKTRPANRDHLEIGYLRLQQRIRAATKVQERFPYGSAADRANHQGPGP